MNIYMYTGVLSHVDNYSCTVETYKDISLTEVTCTFIFHNEYTFSVCKIFV